MFGIFALFALTLSLRGSFTIEDFTAPAPRGRTEIVVAGEIQQDTVYKGQNLRLSATPKADGTWTGSAQFTDDSSRVVKTDTSFSSQSEALSAALSQAMAAVDRDRMFRGKP
jgi:hypothetical protein